MKEKELDFEDLMLHDFVEAVYMEENENEGTEEEKRYYGKIDALDINGNIGEGWSYSLDLVDYSGQEYYDIIESIYGIPVTLEFFKMNGAVLDEEWEDGESDYYFPELADFNHLNFIYFKKENRFQFSFCEEPGDGDENTAFRTVKFIHEFQHLLRKFGHKKFANNLKLPKHD